MKGSNFKQNVFSSVIASIVIVAILLPSFLFSSVVFDDQPILNPPSTKTEVSLREDTNQKILAENPTNVFLLIEDVEEEKNLDNFSNDFSLYTEINHFFPPANSNLESGHLITSKPYKGRPLPLFIWYHSLLVYS